MAHSSQPDQTVGRYTTPTYTAQKRTGAAYTPPTLARFVAEHIVAALPTERRTHLRILDPAAGDGELLCALVTALSEASRTSCELELVGFETDSTATELAQQRLLGMSGVSNIKLHNQDFLEYALTAGAGVPSQPSLFADTSSLFDIVISNPPYVRTQLLGATEARKLSRRFGLSGRVDLYHSFIPAIASVLKECGIMGLIVSNRFMTTRAGESVRTNLLSLFHILCLWDLGDTKLFPEAVLPAVVLGRRVGSNTATHKSTQFTSAYTAPFQPSAPVVESVLDVLDDPSIQFATVENVSYQVRRGTLGVGSSPRDVWRLATDDHDSQLRVVAHRTYVTLGDLGKIRVGVKTTADTVFIRRDWSSLADDERPESELLLPLLTHKEARRWNSRKDGNSAQILYPHVVDHGKRKPVDLAEFPRASKYLHQHKRHLERRTYVTKAGRRWYEIWVPQDPSAWSSPKLVFRDIAETNTFFLDFSGAVVNGDCYWLTLKDPDRENLLWLALAVANSTFALWFYDTKFHNKLYSGRRRFMTQYVEKFPIPPPDSEDSRKAVELARLLFDSIDRLSQREVESLEERLDVAIWSAFGLSKEVQR